jgi:SAF domain
VKSRARAAAFAFGAFACAGLSAAVAGSSQAPDEGFGSLRPVVVTSAPLERATTVGREELRDALTERQVPEAFVPPDALGITEEALGRRLAIPLPAGSYLTAAAFKAPSEGARPRGDPPKGTTPVEIMVTGAGALATSRTDQGDQVDVVVSGDAAPGPSAGRTYVAASGVSLIALREARAEPGLEADRWIATLALRREEALRLIRAESVGAQVRLLAG